VEKAVQVHELWQQDRPEVLLALHHSGGYLQTAWEPEKALEETREAMRLEPNSALIYFNLGADYVLLNRLDEAEGSVQAGGRTKVGV